MPRKLLWHFACSRLWGVAMPSRHVHIIAEEQSGWRLDRALAVGVPTLSRSRIQNLISSGAVQLGDTLTRDPARKVKAGETYTMTVADPTPMDTVAQDIPLTIMFEDDHLLIVDKPAGLVVHPAAGNFDGTLVNALLHHCAGRLSGIGGVARPGIVHRIDKDTSGLLVVAKTDPAHVKLSKQFAAHTVERIYTCVVKGHPVPAVGRIEGNLARSAQDRKKMAIVSSGHGKHAVTHYRTMKKLGAYAALVQAQLETGRTHQVRVHMASIGHALLGDPTYGKSGPLKKLLDELNFHRQALHAGVLGFIHPVTGETMRFESLLPADMSQLISSFAESD
jgi:23S rRNA pseudouridine1911/1915/1917 synthase